MPPEDNKSRVQMRAKIGINAHLIADEASYRRAGIHQYIARVLAHLPQVSADSEYLVFSRHASQLVDKAGFSVQSSRWPTERRLVRIAWEQMAWPWQASRSHLDLLHSMAFVTPVILGIPTVVTVYDLSFIHFPESFPSLQRK